MEVLRVGSVNVNGMRDGEKRSHLAEIIKLKELSVVMLQETHSCMDNEVDWGLWWKGEKILSHGTNLSAGVAVLFSPTLKVKVLSKKEEIPGRLLVIRAEIMGFFFFFVNVYAPNGGADRIQFFTKLEHIFKQQHEGDIAILGGDWNCTLNFIQDRNGEEPHLQSAAFLENIIKNFCFSDVWREHNPLEKQYTWIKICNRKVSGARLDRFYISHTGRNKVANASIIPICFSDHKLITVDCMLVERKHKSYYWHFNVKLLEDKNFCQNFKVFWETWKMEKSCFENIIEWWEVGKAHIRSFCQQYTSHSSLVLKKTLEWLENEIIDIEKSMNENDTLTLQDRWTEKKKKLSSFLNEKVKGALIRSRFLKIRDMDGPSSFFFSLERKTGQEKLMHFLKDNNGHNTSDPITMRRLAVNFYSDLYASEPSNEECRRLLLEDLPVLTPELKLLLEADITFEEVTAAVMGLSTGRTPGLDGLPAEFYKAFWAELGKDVFEVLQECVCKGVLPLSCQRAVLTLLPKKGDLTLLKNWRPVAILSSDYKIFSKCLSNRLNLALNTIIHKDQSYCIMKRSITDNLHLIRDAYDVVSYNELDLGFLSIDQEKAFDRVDHTFLFDTLRAFGFGDGFISKIQLLYKGATCMIKVAGGLSVPVKVQRGIRQGCPLSGQLYSLVIEPLLCKLREKLTGLEIKTLDFKSTVKLSAYADDVTVLIRNNEDVRVLKEVLECYSKASSANVNWEKSDALWCGRDFNSPILPCGLKWGKEGFKYLGVFLGTDEYKKKNWEGLKEKVCARLCHWKWLIPQLSYRGRVLVCNNLVASSLWHKMMILDPPEDMVKIIQQLLVDFFWTGQHWLKAATLYLPLQEGGQGLVDIMSRVKAFRLQTTQRLLYGENVSWAGVACAILRRAGQMGLDRHLFLMDTNKLDLSGLTPFYRSMLRSWTLFRFSREHNGVKRLWSREEPLLYNPALDLDILNSLALRKALKTANIFKIGHFVSENGWITAEDLASKLGMRSVRATGKLLTQIVKSLPSDYILSLVTNNGENTIPAFPELVISANTRTWSETENSLLSFKTPEPRLFSIAGKKSIYVMCVKTSNLFQLQSVRETKWKETIGPNASPKGCWRSLYKPPIEKRTGDLQWRIVHCIVATNCYRARLDPQIGEGCPFCGEPETVFHLFLNCKRLQPIFYQLEEWCQNLGEAFTPAMFIYGPKYNKNRREHHVLLNFLFGQAKMAIWLSRKSKLNDKGSTDAFLILKGLTKSRINVEYGFYKMVNDLAMFNYKWGVNQCICHADSENVLNIYL